MKVLLGRLAPALFVFLWSTGFIGVKYGIPYAPPFLFVAIRMAIAAALLGAIALIVTKQWGITRSSINRSAAIGLTLHGAYLGGCFYAVSIGMTAGITALIVSLQPVLVSIFASIFLGEKLEAKKVIGLALGLLGLILVVVPRMQGVQADIPTAGLIACVVGLLGGTSGTILQKKYGAGIPMLAGASVQYAVTAAVLGAVALATEDLHIQWSGEFIFALSWLIIALSIGAILTLFLLLKSGTAASVSSLYYLVPAVTAVMAYFLFDEKISLISALGAAITIAGVWLVTAKK